MHHRRPPVTLILIAMILAPLPCIPGCAPPRVHSMRVEGDRTSATNPSPEELLSKIGLRFIELVRSRSEGFPTVTITAMNPSPYPRAFQYRVVWFAPDGIPIESQTSRWMPESPLGGQTATIRSVAPRQNADGFRLELSRKD
jgi:uncharacterized protein YcfL